MKLRNLLFGTMIACAFVACSNDDDPTPEPTPEVGTGTLIAGLDSKALTKANSSEITSLIVALYRADGSFVQSATLADNQPTEIEADNDVKFTGLPVDVEYTIVALPICLQLLMQHKVYQQLLRHLYNCLLVLILQVDIQ